MDKGTDTGKTNGGQQNVGLAPVVTPPPPSITKPLNTPLTPAELLKQVTLIKQVQEAVMVKDTHYGTIAGCKQPSLLKAGAEKLCLTFRFAVNPIIEDLSMDDEIRYRVRLELSLQNTGLFIGAGIGECSSNEEKYRWRRALCNEEYDETSEDRRKTKWTKYDRKPTKIKMVRTNPSDLANTILKMAKKRALVDAILTNTGASDVFVQDLEDLEESTREHLLAEEKATSQKPDVETPKIKKKPASKPETAKPKEQPQPNGNPTNDNGLIKMITDKQISLLQVKCKDKGLTLDDILVEFKIEKIEDMPRNKVNDALTYISSFK